MMQVYPSAGYKFEFNPVIKSPITIYGPNQKKICSISGPTKADSCSYKIKCEDWLLSQGLVAKKDYNFNVGRILMQTLI